MKFTIDARLISSSGIGVYIQNIIASALLSKYQIRLYYRKADSNYFKNIPSNAEMIPFEAELYSIKELLTSPAITANTDIFWSPHYNVPAINFASKLKIVTIHDVFHLAHYRTLSAAQKLYAKGMVRHAVKSSDIIFTVSNFSKSEIVKYTQCDPGKIKVIYNGVDFKKFSALSSNEQKQGVLAKYKINTPFILFVGNIKPHKNLKNALLGFKEFMGKNSFLSSDYKFVIAGKREGFITGDKEISALLSDPFYTNKVQFTGWVDDEDLPSLYQQALTFVFPSLYEGFGFPPLEAMSAGCPVISSNAACLPEIYGDAVLFFDPLKPSEIAEALSSVIYQENIRKKLVENGMRQAMKYSWNEAIKQKLKFIEEYAARKL